MMSLRNLSRAVKASCIAATFVIMGAASAQPTGNPKGTGSPGTSDSQKAPAARPPADARGTTDSGKLDSGKGPAEARMHTGRGPGTGTAGGLPKRTPQDGAPRRSDAGPTDRPDPK